MQEKKIHFFFFFKTRQIKEAILIMDSYQKTPLKKLVPDIVVLSRRPRCD